MDYFKKPYIHPKPLSQIKKYKLTKTLGQGSMGKVKLGTNIETGEFVAVKIIPRYPPEWSSRPKKRHHVRPDPNNIDPEKPHPPATLGIDPDASPPVDIEFDVSRDLRILRESYTMKLLDHPNIVKLIDFVLSEHHYYLVFEYFHGKQLLDVVVGSGRMREEKGRAVIRQILGAIDYCHKNNVVHRDLKIENIMLAEGKDAYQGASGGVSGGGKWIRRKSDGDAIDDDSLQVKILDFGLSNFHRKDKLLSTFCGSLYFAAPELLHSQKYKGPEIDIWSIGVVSYVLMCGQVPFEDGNLSVLHAKIKQGRVDYPPFLTTSCIHFLKSMLTVNPKQRATMEELKNHPWIHGATEFPMLKKPTSIYLGQRRPMFFPQQQHQSATFLSANSSEPSSIGDRFKSLAFRSEPITKVPIPDHVPKRLPLGKMSGIHPNPDIIALLKRNPFDAANNRCPITFFSSSQQQQKQTHNFMPTPPTEFKNAAAGAGGVLKVVEMNDPFYFGYGGGFGFDPAQVDQVLYQVITDTDITHPIVTLYHLIHEWMIKNPQATLQHNKLTAGTKRSISSVSQGSPDTLTDTSIDAQSKLSLPPSLVSAGSNIVKERNLDQLENNRPVLNSVPEPDQMSVITTSSTDSQNNAPHPYPIDLSLALTKNLNRHSCITHWTTDSPNKLYLQLQHLLKEEGFTRQPLDDEPPLDFLHNGYSSIDQTKPKHNHLGTSAGSIDVAFSNKRKHWWVSQWQWQPSIKNSSISNGRQRFVVFRVEWVQIISENELRIDHIVPDGRKPMVRYGVVGTRISGDMDLFSLVWQRVQWQWKQIWGQDALTS